MDKALCGQSPGFEPLCPLAVATEMDLARFVHL